MMTEGGWKDVLEGTTKKNRTLPLSFTIFQYGGWKIFLHVICFKSYKMTEISLFQGVSPCFSLSNRIDKRFDISDLSNRFYRPLINFLLITIPNGKGNLSISARACWLGNTTKQRQNCMFCNFSPWDFVLFGKSTKCQQILK